MKTSVKDKYEVRPIPASYASGWCLKKHYAGRVPPIVQAFGLYEKSGMLTGVCTFGTSANYREAEAWDPFELRELNRLIVDEGAPENTTSFFVGQCIKRIERPMVLISYADLGMSHYGYIYQATNWIYTGISGAGQNVYIMRDGRELHQRTVDIGDGGKYKKMLYNTGQITGIKKTKGKARYYYFCADKRTKKRMMEMLRFPVLPYPKGDGKRYDASYKRSSMQLF